MRIRDKVAKIGVKLIATGQSRFGDLKGVNVAKSLSGVSTFTSVLGHEAEIILEFMDSYIQQNGVDVIIGEEFLSMALACISRRHQIPIIFLSTTLQHMPYTYPSWPWPGITSKAVSDNLNFQQRFLVPLNRLMGGVFWNYIVFILHLNRLGKFCPGLSDQFLCSAPGTHLPQIIPSVIGVEYPRTISPLTHYVGPVLTKSPDPLPTDLQLWLSEKHDRSVIYISMGSHVPTSEELGSTIVSVIAKSNYSAVWALRNNSLLETLTIQLDRSKLFVTSWAPQLSVLGHRAIRMAILHGGANGVHEALYNEVPIVVVPQFLGDQIMIANRISHYKLGVHIPATNLSLSSISGAIREIDDGDYVSNIHRLKKIFIQAGGVKRAADLVEHYEDVGYSHLVPAYAKYDWTWIQYYNVDVYLLLGTLLGLVLYASFRCCKCACSRCCTCFQGKEKAD
jgi:glucuronosyltransferase